MRPRARQRQPPEPRSVQHVEGGHAVATLTNVGDPARLARRVDVPGDATWPQRVVHLWRSTVTGPPAAISASVASSVAAREKSAETK